MVLLVELPRLLIKKMQFLHKLYAQILHRDALCKICESRGEFLQAPARRSLRLRPRGCIEDDADLDERAAGARSGFTTIGHRRLLLYRRRVRSFRGCGIGCSCGQAAPHVDRWDNFSCFSRCVNVRLRG
jgi:hypothetical protein